MTEATATIGSGTRRAGANQPHRRTMRDPWVLQIALALVLGWSIVGYPLVSAISTILGLDRVG